MVPSEDDEQIRFVQYLEMRNLKFTAIPNHTYTKSWKQKNHNKALGLRAGLCDMLIALPGTGLLFLELKRVKNSTTSAAQQSWIDILNQCPGTAAHIAKGADQAIAFVEHYLDGKPLPDVKAKRATRKRPVRDESIF